MTEFKVGDLVTVVDVFKEHVGHFIRPIYISEIIDDTKEALITDGKHGKTSIYLTHLRKATVEEPSSKPPQQVGGNHYETPIQPIEYIEANGLGFHEANVIKYVTRYKNKNGLEDLKKARWYLDRLISNLEVPNEFN